jgi:hypothetical protein
MTKKSITEEELRAVLTATGAINTCIFTSIMTDAFPPKFKAQHNQVISVSNTEGDFSDSIFRKFMHMENGRYQCLGNSHLHEGKYYRWAFARALTEVELGGAEVDGSNVAPDVTADESFDLEGTLSLLEYRLGILEKAPREKFATREDLASLLATLILALGNNDRGYSLLRSDDRDMLKDLKRKVLRCATVDHTILEV